MSSGENVPQQLKEIVERGFPEPQYLDVLQSGTYNTINRQSTSIDVSATTGGAVTSTGEIQVGYCFDGSFLPVRHGAGYTLYSLMRALSQTGRVYPSLINCYRGWDAPSRYYDQEFRSVFVHPDDYYNQTGVIEAAFENYGIRHAQFYSPEGLLNLGERLRHIGSRVLLEIQNTDHVLLQRLGASAVEVGKARDLEKQALEIADHSFCRSEIDRQHAIALGAAPDSVSVYKGGIHTKDFTFQPRLEQRHRLVFLGHMYYQPNENALDYIANEVLPSLDDSYVLTVVGIAPPKVLAKYDDPRIIFKEGVDDLNAELLEHDVALAPLREGSGTRLKVLDYLASGLPVITTNIGIEGLDPKLANYLTVDDDLGGYAQHIQDIVSDPDAYAKRSLQARQFIEGEYDWSVCVDPFLQVYQANS